MNRARTRAAVAAAAWLVVLGLIFILLSGETTAADWVGAGACAVVAAVVTVPMTRMRLFDLRFRVGWLRHIPAAAWQVVVDFGVVTAFLLRALVRRERGSGAFVARRDFPAGAADAEGTAWRGFVSMTSTLSPNSYVVDIDHEDRHRLSHDLVPSRRSEQPA
ncbi:MAG TPA: hypothetical protein VFN68_17780 [Acidimicrobiales bacterium]|nr:hypothetical protein [Acidimicrobiales bacterium]